MLRCSIDLAGISMTHEIDEIAARVETNSESPIGHVNRCTMNIVVSLNCIHDSFRFLSRQ